MPHQFRADHDELRRFMRDYITLLDGDPAATLPALLRARIGFSGIYYRHRQAEGQAALAAGRRRPDLAAIATRLAEGDRSLDADYSAHLRRWDPPGIAADWSGYRDDVIALQHRLRERMVWEEREAFPLLGFAG